MLGDYYSTASLLGSSVNRVYDCNIAVPVDTDSTVQCQKNYNHTVYILSWRVPAHDQAGSGLGRVFAISALQSDTRSPAPPEVCKWSARLISIFVPTQY